MAKRGSATVPRQALVDALEKLQRLRGRFKKTMHGHWKFDPVEGLAIGIDRWEVTVEGALVSSPGSTTVDALVMKTLHEVLPRQDVLHVVGQWQSLQIGSFKIGPALPASEQLGDLHPHSEDASVLTATTALTPEDRSARGLAAQYGDTTRRLEAAVKQANVFLAPFGVQEIELLRWVLTEAQKRRARL